MHVAALPNRNNHILVMIPPPGVAASHLNQGLFPGTISQTPGMMLHEGQLLDHPMNQLPGANGPPGTVYTGRILIHLKGEPNVLGAIQILIGLVHIGFGSVLTRLVGVYMSAIVVSGYVYWGGLFFIISGSLTVAAERHKTACLVKGSLGMNIMSSLIATAAIITFLIDMVSFPRYNDSPYLLYRRLAQGLSSVLLVFSILEFFIGIASSSFGCEAVCYQASQATYFVPDAVISHQGLILPVDPPPSYEAHVNVAYESANQTE